MKILVDGDACPVLNMIVSSAKKYGFELFVFADTCHQLHINYGTVVVADKGNESADFALLSKCETGDIVVTNDYGLASLAMAKKASALNFRGIEYTDDNIDRLLFERHLFKQERRSKGVHIKSSKRPQSSGNFRDNFDKFISEKDVIEKENI